MRIEFDKINEFMRIYGGTIYLVLFGAGKYDSIYNRIGYLIGIRSSITYVFSHTYARLKTDSYDSLPLEKSLTFYNVIILIKLAFNKNKNNYYDIFLQKYLYKLW